MQTTTTPPDAKTTEAQTIADARQRMGHPAGAVVEVVSEAEWAARNVAAKAACGALGLSWASAMPPFLGGDTWDEGRLSWILDHAPRRLLEAVRADAYVIPHHDTRVQRQGAVWRVSAMPFYTLR